MIYAGALLPAGIVVLDGFLAGLRALRERDRRRWPARLRVHFVGTGSLARRSEGHRVLPRAREPASTTWSTSIRTASATSTRSTTSSSSDAVLVLGSTERHYTPSKVFQAILSKRPVFAMLHAESTAIGMIEHGAGRAGAAADGETAMPRPDAVAAGLRRWSAIRRTMPSAVDGARVRVPTRPAPRPARLPMRSTRPAREGPDDDACASASWSAIRSSTTRRSSANWPSAAISRCSSPIGRRRAGQAKAGYGVAFEWDVDLLSGYQSRFLTNVARQPSTDAFSGCDTPGIAEEIARGTASTPSSCPAGACGPTCRRCAPAGGRSVPVLVRGDSQLASQRGGAIRLAKALIFPRFLKRFDGFLYVGQRNREYLEHYGVPADRLFFSPHCIDNEAFRRASDAARRTKPPDGHTARRVLFVGKLIESQAAARPAACGRPHPGHGGQVEVAFAGAGEARGRASSRPRQTPVSARRSMGFVNQSELPAVYAAADVIVLPSRRRPGGWWSTRRWPAACRLSSPMRSAAVPT